ncbi:hypothetical protein EVB32_079 [Rhizobium phage RHph_TM39]|uniref:Uncharacterized protein n=1 Tax=Rhizobium phage RHph_TM30 TaxID=2509764 RepID=A0A7S5R4U7_9CAUD|nr:hypothetical protein PQC16_gp079 [Rhizobium phage RHph_TM30]QIG71550.1 hypothetical protein EVB94_079 [Rhizobium phage RHph_TM40]QIG71913.1 hypothetical protein EVB95_079 [Rhizobium phage RHph_TM2_3B]QIG72275.1 hypothetical protein EVB96_079 [Rhizobium phage RHph_TM3_3_6]QIG77067.1 hypothetical protein EVB32_079 [Rhizobium phage RHph_TM39]QIG77666.1 hypothetical protein EVB64_079 [Rhizobium phage RHph_TM61]
MKILSYKDSMYPEDNRILGIFDDDTDESILNEMVKDEILSSIMAIGRREGFHKQNEMYYHIEYDVPYLGNKLKEDEDDEASVA